MAGKTIVLVLWISSMQIPNYAYAENPSENNDNHHESLSEILNRLSNDEVITGIKKTTPSPQKTLSSQKRKHQKSFKKQKVKQKKAFPISGKKRIFLKKDSNGNTIGDNAEKWSCVEDVNSGLLWEVKTKDGGLRDKNNSYSWFQPSTTTEPQGTADGGQCKGGTDCDTLSYIKAINDQNYCGYSNWRLPTQEEMLTIVYFDENNSSSKINSKYFPETLPSWYWTISSNKNNPRYAWYILFKNGIALSSPKEHPKHIRLVSDKKIRVGQSAN